MLEYAERNVKTTQHRARRVMSTDDSPRRPLHRLALGAGLVGPFVFVATFTTEGCFRPGYDARATYISALSLGPRGWIQILNFMVLGALLLVFARAVATELADGKASRAGPVLLGIFAIGILASGPFVMDPAGTPLENMSLHGLAHQVLGAIVLTVMPATCIVFVRRFRADPALHTLFAWTSSPRSSRASRSCCRRRRTPVFRRERRMG